MSADTLVKGIFLELIASDHVDETAVRPLLEQLEPLLTTDEMRRLHATIVTSIFIDDMSSISEAIRALEELNLHLQNNGHSPVALAVPVDTVLKYNTSLDNDILDTFYAEFAEHLNTLEQKLLILEKQPSAHEALQSAFRAMHSIKGNAGFLEIPAVQKLAHEGETLLHRAQSRIAGLHEEECDAILRSLDVLREIRSSLVAHAQTKTADCPPLPQIYAEVLLQLQALCKNESKPVQPVTPLATPPVEPGKVQPDEHKRSRLSSTTARLEARDMVRVKVAKLDSLMETIGELIVAQAQMERAAESGLNQAREFFPHMRKIAHELQSVAMSLRALPLRETFQKATRMARDLARSELKQLEIVVHGEETEIDKNVIEAIADPLMHIIRNAVDHGIGLPLERAAEGKPEHGTITLSARGEGSHILIEVADDGSGLNRERILQKAREHGWLRAGQVPSEEQLFNFIFEPGFSTASQVTHISGRGVGLDVVKKNIEALSGRVHVTSQPGKFTKFTLILPLTVSVIDGLLVRVGTERYVLPTSAVLECLRPARGQISSVHSSAELISVRNRAHVLVRLHEFARVIPDAQEAWCGIVLMVDTGVDKFALLVDELLGQQQFVLKSLGSRFHNVKAVSGGAVLGDGRVGLVLDAAGLFAVMRESMALSVAGK